MAGAVISWPEDLVWVRAPDFVLNPDEPVPLISSPNRLVPDRRATEALERAKRSFEIVFSAFDGSSRIAAVGAAVGCMVMPRSHVPPPLVIDRDGLLPEVGPVAAGIITREDLDAAELKPIIAALKPFLPNHHLRRCVAVHLGIAGLSMDAGRAKRLFENKRLLENKCFDGRASLHRAALPRLLLAIVAAVVGCFAGHARAGARRLSAGPDRAHHRAARPRNRADAWRGCSRARLRAMENLGRGREPAGAASDIGMAYVAAAPPDGYTFLLVAAQLSISPALKKNLPFDPVKS
jgi:hypothetical protein